jgi:hypothetical protein
MHLVFTSDMHFKRRFLKISHSFAVLGPGVLKFMIYASFVPKMVHTFEKFIANLEIFNS